MKKLITLLCVTAMLFMFAGCTGAGNNETDSGTNGVTDTTDRIEGDIKDGIDDMKDGMDSMIDGNDTANGTTGENANADGTANEDTAK